MCVLRSDFHIVHHVMSVKWKTERGNEHSHAGHHKECHLLPSSTTLQKLDGYTSVEIVSLRHYISFKVLSIPVERPYASFYVWSQKLEISLYRAAQSIFRYLEPFRRNSQVWQTDRHYDSKCRASVRCAAKIIRRFPNRIENCSRSLAITFTHARKVGFIKYK